MQSSSRSRPFKSGLIGASPITDAICPRSSVRLERHRAKVEVTGAIPVVDATFIYDLRLMIEQRGALPASNRKS
jgi:hypothetical protein